MAVKLPLTAAVITACHNVPAVSHTADGKRRKLPEFQRHRGGKWNPEFSGNFASTPATAAGSITGRVTNALNGAALSGVTVRYSGGSTTTDSTGAFHLSAPFRRHI